jgi:outer membrane biosynthesis protein TonB
MTVAPAPVAKPPEPVPVPEPAPATAPEPAPVKVARARPAAAPKPEAQTTPPPAAPESPADFTGTTLTNDRGDAWSSATGNGAAMTGPVGPAGAKRGPVAKPGVIGGTGTTQGPPVVALGDLSQAPAAPDLNDLLAHYYPHGLRQQGRSGKAVVRARIGADGQARVVSVLSESAAGFGDACRRTLHGSHWKPPLDRQGKPVATELSYTCRFEVGS